MQVVILAAGRGTRLKELTAQVPKPMLPVRGKPILERTLAALPRATDEIVLMVGYKQEVIKRHFGDAYENIPIRYVPMDELGGTGMALPYAAPVLRDEPFLVVFGDDLRAKSDLERIAELPLAFGIWHGVPNHAGYAHIETNDRGELAGFRSVLSKEVANGIRVATGVFMLDRRILSYEPVRIANGEFGLPQTILRMAKDIPVPVVHTDLWLPITHPEDLERVERHPSL